jgi:hypothetical protein
MVVGPPLQPPGPVLSLAGLTILDDPGLGGNAAAARLALRSFSDYYRPDGVPWSGWCEMFVGDVLAALGIDHPRFPTALADAISAPLYRGRAPAGSLVFFDARISPYGHVGIALGDGTMLSALGGGIVRTDYEDWPSYVGWRPGGTAAADPIAAPTTVAPAPAAIPAAQPRVIAPATPGPRIAAGAPPIALPTTADPLAAPTAAARVSGPKPASTAIGSTGVAAGIVGLPSVLDGWMIVPVGGWHAAASDVITLVGTQQSDPAAPVASTVTSAASGAVPLGEPGSGGAVVGRGGGGAAPGTGGRGLARWQDERVLLLFGVGGAVLLLLVGLGMQRRQAVLAVTGRRV